MDYRNADGSIAEMCGNGVRVFARYLQRERLIGNETVVGTRGGPRRVWLDGSGDITVEMGGPTFPDLQQRVTSAPLQSVRGTVVDIPNPHVVVPVSHRGGVAGAGPVAFSGRRPATGRRAERRVRGPPGRAALVDAGA